MFKFGSDKFTKKTLPKNFADQILNLEMEVELNEQVQIEVLQDLISLYMVGVEYYESIKDRRHLFFQKKLNALMVKPTFINTTNKFDEAPKQPDIKNKRAKFEEESRRIELDLIYSQTENKEAQVKGIVDNHTNQVKKIETIIQKEIATQSDAFQQRLERRRKSKLTHSLSQPEIDLQSQKSGNSNKKKQKESQQANNPVELKQVIQEEDEAAAARKNSTVLQKTIINKIRTNSLIHKSKNVTIIIKRSNSQGTTFKAEIDIKELIKEKEKIALLYKKFTQTK